jgi:hypothetical protein
VSGGGTSFVLLRCVNASSGWVVMMNVGGWTRPGAASGVAGKRRVNKHPESKAMHNTHMARRIASNCPAVR